MARYGEALARKDRETVASLYHPDGTWFVMNGRRGFETYADVRDGYLNKWRGPDSFAWKDLAYETVGPDSVVVVGGFAWGSEKGVREFSYTGLLKRTANGWRIRLEDETPVPVNRTTGPG